MPKRIILPPEPGRLEMGCWSALVIPGIIGIAIALTSPRQWFAAVLAIPLALALWFQVTEIALLLRAARKWRNAGIRGVLVYSRSPNWQDYVETEWLPRINAKLVILNWSDQLAWNQRDLAVRIFRRFVGTSSEYNPSAVVLRGVHTPLVFRFYSAFKNAKHGNSDGLKQLESRLFSELQAG